MEKFTEELEKWVKERDKQRQRRRKDASAVEFLSVKNDVVEAINKGYSLKTIWEYLREDGKVQSTYETFRRHAKRFIASNNQPKAEKPGSGSSSTEIATFNYNTKIDDKELF